MAKFPVRLNERIQHEPIPIFRVFEFFCTFVCSHRLCHFYRSFCSSSFKDKAHKFVICKLHFDQMNVFLK